MEDLVARPAAAVEGTELEAADKHDQRPCGHDYDAAAGLIHYEESHPYGTTAYRAGDSGIDVSPRRYRYTGMEQDEETGLGYHTARYYAGWLGRWTASDPIGLGGGVNRFGYVEGRVGGSSDASGLAPPDDASSSDADAADLTSWVLTLFGVPLAAAAGSVNWTDTETAIVDTLAGAGDVVASWS